MPRFELQFPPARIDELAGRFSYADDSACLQAGRSARLRGSYDRAEFLVVCEWKTTRSAPKVALNASDTVRERTRAAFSSPNERTRMEALLGLSGVGVPTASALLYFAYPDDYPILDVRALESLDVDGRTQYPVSFWLEYLDACRRLARQNRVPLRTLDKALWQFSKERPNE